MGSAVFASRNRKELMRDPLTLAFGIGFPLVLLLLISVLQRSISVDIFRAENFAPGMAVFSLSFIAISAGTLIAKDRSTSFLTRLFASPLSASDFVMGYALSMLPTAILQTVVCFTAAFFVGLPVSLNVLLATLVLIPVAVLFIGFGLLLGSSLTDKQVGGIGSMLINIATLLGGTWFDLNLMGGTLKTIGYALPFAHAVDAARAALVGDYGTIMPHLWWVLSYAVVIFAAAVVIFRRRMRSGTV